MSLEALTARRTIARTGTTIDSTVTDPAPLSASADLWVLVDGQVEGPVEGWAPRGAALPIVGDRVWFTRSQRGVLVIAAWVPA